MAAANEHGGVVKCEALEADGAGGQVVLADFVYVGGTVRLAEGGVAAVPRDSAGCAASIGALRLRGRQPKGMRVGSLLLLADCWERVAGANRVVAVVVRVVPAAEVRNSVVFCVHH